MKRMMVAVLAFWASVASANNTEKYNPEPYLADQFMVIEERYSLLEVEQRDSNIVITIPADVGFEVGKATLTRPMRDELKSLGKYLASHNESLIGVYGHTDSTGTFQRNKQLSLERATTVAEQLMLANVVPYRMNIVAEADEVPKCTNQTSKGRACNRRVELVVTHDPNIF